MGNFVYFFWGKNITWTTQRFSQFPPPYNSLVDNAYQNEKQKNTIRRINFSKKKFPRRKNKVSNRENDPNIMGSRKKKEEK